MLKCSSSTPWCKSSAFNFISSTVFIQPLVPLSIGDLIPRSLIPIDSYTMFCNTPAHIGYSIGGYDRFSDEISSNAKKAPLVVFALESPYAIVSIIYNSSDWCVPFHLEVFSKLTDEVLSVQAYSGNFPSTIYSVVYFESHVHVIHRQLLGC